MIYVAIALVLVLVIAPIISVLPSARQKEQMSLRKIAMSAGFSIDLTHIDDPDPDPEKYLSNTGKPLPRVMPAIAYRLPRRGMRDVPLMDWCVVRRSDSKLDELLPPGWTWVSGATANMSNEFKTFLHGSLEKLPNDVIRVEEVNRIVSVYWNEQGGTDAVNAIIAFAKHCVAIVPHAAPSNSF